MDSDLTPQEARYIEGVLAGKPRSVAAVEAGYSPSYAAQGNLHKREKLKNALAEAMERLGIDADSMALTMKEGLKANKPIIEGRKLVEFPDHPTRHKFLELGAKVMGYTEDTKVMDVNFGIFEVPVVAKTPEEWNQVVDQAEENKPKP